MLMLCSKCGAEIEENEEFCKECAAAEEEGDNVQTSDVPFGEEVLPTPDAPGDNVQTLDMPFGEEALPTPGAPEEEKPNKKILKIVVPVAALGLALLIVVALMIAGVISTGQSGGLRPAGHSAEFGYPSARMPRNGGVFTVSETTEFIFRPDQSGMWLFLTSDNGGSDPYLEILNSEGIQLDFDDDSAGDYNAIIQIYLIAGDTYYLYAGYFDCYDADFTLTVSLRPPIPGNGGIIRVVEETGFFFRPAHTGTWDIYTSNNNGDPLLVVIDVEGNLLGIDDDGGIGLNASLTLDLIGGFEYIVYAGFYEDEIGSYDLNVILR